MRKILDSPFGESLGSQSSLFAIANLSGGVGYPKRRYKHPGGDEDLAEEIAADRVNAEWFPEELHPESSRGERGESIEAPED